MTRHHDLGAMKTAEYAFWAGQPTHVVMTAVAEMTAEAYAMKGIRVSRDDLIAAKLAAGRPRDLADVDELRKAGAAMAGHAEPASVKPRGVRKRPKS